MNDRRWFLKIATMAAGSLALQRSLDAQDSKSSVRINGERLRRNLEGLSLYGRPAGGTFESGVSRTAYSDADVAGHKFVVQLIREAGLEPRFDAAANLLATRAGSDSSLKTLLFAPASFRRLHGHANEL